ncbi:hypothetical protein BCR79_24925 (plasmid) [Escherichia coli]|nr:hypothetical protein BCR79_24925 [Escherichia coli]
MNKTKGCLIANFATVPKKALSDEQAATLRQRATAGEPKAQLAREFNISRETLYQYLRTDD